MTKKHFMQVAKIFKDKVDDPSLRALLALEFVEMFKKENPRFNESTFLNGTKRNSGVQ